jgi:hypothetical protein
MNAADQIQATKFKVGTKFIMESHKLRGPKLLYKVRSHSVLGGVASATAQRVNKSTGTAFGRGKSLPLSIVEKYATIVCLVHSTPAGPGPAEPRGEKER